jgi:cytidylate kinase
MIIVIDGPVAKGKSTVAKKLAESLGFIYFDTGAMYRAITYELLKKGINLEDQEAVNRALEEFKFDIRIRRGYKTYLVAGEDVTDEIRSQAVTSKVSQVAAIRGVRDKLVAIQRQLAHGVNAVFEGRDLGTVVFPDAELKIFLTGRLEERAQRRLQEIRRDRPKEAENLTLEDVVKEVAARDHLDSTREISPLTKAPDAFAVDTSDLSVDEVVFQILECKDQAKSRKKQ